MPIARRTVTVVALVAAAFTFTACSSVSSEVIEESPEYIELHSGFVKTAGDYVNGSSHTEMTKCKDRGFWSATFLESSDKTVRLTYHKNKSSYSDVKITVDGETYKGRCMNFLTKPTKCWHDNEKAD